MAIGWLTVLQSVPWTDVVRNAPKVAVGAKKLWSTVRKKPLSGASPAADAPAASAVQSLPMLALRIQELETDAADLQAQMVASSEVIKALAEQNTQLIVRVETLRVRLLWLAGTLAGVGVASGAALLLVLLR